MDRQTHVLVGSRSVFARSAVTNVLREHGATVCVSEDLVAVETSSFDAVVIVLDSEDDLDLIPDRSENVASELVIAGVFASHQAHLAHEAAAAGALVVINFESTNRLVDCIHRAADGNATIPDFVLNQLTGDRACASPMRDREIDWLRRLHGGLTVAELAKEVNYSERSVHRHLSELYARLGVGSRREAMALLR